MTTLAAAILLAALTLAAASVYNTRVSICDVKELWT